MGRMASGPSERSPVPALIFNDPQLHLHCRKFGRLRLKPAIEQGRTHEIKAHRVLVALVTWRHCYDVLQRLSGRIPAVVAAHARNRHARVIEARAPERLRALVACITRGRGLDVLDRLAFRRRAIMAIGARRFCSCVIDMAAAKRPGALVARVAGSCR